MPTPSALLYPHAITALCAALMFGACGGGDLSLPPEGQPATVTILDGNEQSGRVGEPLPDPLLIEVADSRGQPVANATVAFEFSSAGPGAAVVPEQKTTNAAGQADARLVLGTTIGTQTGQVRVVSPAGSEPVQTSFTAIALPENANSMAAAGGQDQTGHVLQPLDDRLVVEVTDGFGNPVAGVPITWSAEGGGSVSENIVPTDEDGRSRVERILGPVVGQQTTLASSEGLAGSPVIFVHTAIAGDASRLTIVSGDGQSGAVGTLLPAELVVRLIDSEGNGVPNTAVTWVPAIGGGTPNPQNTTTDNDGRTSTQWTLGPALGDQRMDAVVSGVGVASFTATATAGAPASLFIRTQPSSAARNGIPFEQQPVVQLRDPQGNDVATAGVQVAVSLNGGGELEGTTRVTTDASGQATFTDLAIAGAPGARTLVFQAVGFAPVTSTPIALAAIGTTTTIIGDAPDPSGVGAAFTVSFRVASAGPIPTGNVTVSDGVQSCAGPLSNGGGSCQLALNTAGQRTLTATYIGVPGLTGSSDTEPHTVTAAPPPPPASTTTTITSDLPDPSASGVEVTLSVQVTSGAGTPTGTVTVTVSGGVATCTITLIGGEGSCRMRLDVPGARTFTATYQGGSGFAGSSDTEDHLVTAQPPPPNQAPEARYNSTCNGLTCQFTDTSSDGDGQVVSWSWNFGDGGTSPAQNPAHTFASAGTYTVTLTVTDNAGATDATTSDVRVEAPPPQNQAPTAEFTAECDELECDFEDESSDPDGRIVDRLWNFGDGTTSDDRNPDHEYATGGTYQVTLTVTDNDGATGSVTHAVTVNAPPPPPASTNTTITGVAPEPSDPGAPITVSFTVSSSGGTPTGTVVVSDENGGGCSGSAPSGSCTYTPNGTGTRTITASYEGSASFTGSSDTEEHTVATPPANTITSITADSPDPSDPGAEITVSFSVSSSEGTPTGTVVVSDAIGGGCSGSAPTGSCSYTPSGTGTRTITATYGGSSSFNGSSATTEHTVTPPPAETNTSILGTAPEPSDPGAEITVSFIVSSSGGTPTGTVEIADANGGGCSGSAPSGSCNYTPTGTGNRTITATYSGNASFTGSSDTEEHVVSEPPVNNAPVATIGSISCTGMNCTFSDASTDPDGNGTIAEWNWIFGDGDTSTERNPSHVYSAPAEYQVRLTVTDDGALSDEAGPQAVTVAQSAGDGDG